MRSSNVDIRALCDELESICEAADRIEAELAAELDQVHPTLRDSAGNLLHYIALRQVDVRGIQQRLHRLGLSSLGRAERHTRSSIRLILKNLKKLYFNESCTLIEEQADFDRSDAMFDQHVRDLLGEARDGRSTRIMVTLSATTATDPQLVAALAGAGMDIARINTAHDDEGTWLSMIDNVRRCDREDAPRCRVAMDLAGPKIRTGPLKPGPRVRRIKPRRDARGRVVAPRRLRLTASEDIEAIARPHNLPVSRRCVERAMPGDELSFRDTRGKKRVMTVVEQDGEDLIVEIWKPAYIATGTKLKLRCRKTGEKHRFRVGLLPPLEQPLRLRAGDTLILHRGREPGEPARLDRDGQVVEAAHIACVPGDVFDHIGQGTAIRLNDGKIEGIVRAASRDRLSVEITRAKATGSRLRGGKGINFPGADFGLAALSNADRRNLTFIAEHADTVGLSFVRAPTDVDELQARLDALGKTPPGIILKIETLAAFDNLPRLLLAGMRRYPVGIMIARGDLAVECGWERLAEIQEEILWLSEAARVPVIWATQVLEAQATKGMPSRAEITDAAMAQRADCVMLNKGPYAVEAVRMLDDILVRMQAHQDKKTSMMRKLRVSNLGPG
jgi:pyruvate kinase